MKLPTVVSVTLITALIVTITSAQQQDIPSNLTSYGSEFFLGFYEHVHTANTHIFYVHTMKTTSVSFTVTSLDGSFTYSGTTRYHSPASVSIPYAYEVRDRGYTWRKKGLKISSLETEPISVIAWSYRSSADYMAYLGLPCHEQPTTEYTYVAVSTYGWSNQMSQFLIVGCMNGTNITIIPNNRITVPTDPQVNGSPNTVIQAGSSYNFTLNSMETFFVFQPYVDLTGSKIISNKPLTVISGHEASRVPAGINDADPIVTQLTPTITWGKSFLLAPHAGRTNGQSYKVIAAESNTTATRTCGLSGGTTSTINFGKNNTDWFYTTTNTYCSIQSDKPIFVAQIGVSTNYAGGSYGDPALFNIPSIDQFDQLTQFTAFTQATGYYSVVMPNDQYYTGQLRINGYIQNITFVPIYNSTNNITGYGYTSLISGSNTIQHPASNGKLFVSVYGWTTYGGYGYPGSMRLNPLNVANLLPEITFTATEYTANEGDGMVYVLLERRREFEANVTVQLYTNPSPVDTALLSQDYSEFNVDVTFLSGETSKNISIPIIDDMYTEPTQYFTVSILSLEDEGEVVFPITDAVIKIIDDDSIQIGLTNGWFLIGDDGLTNVGVKITDGQLEPGVPVDFKLQIMTDSENSTTISCELSSFNPSTSFGIDLSQLSSFDPNVTQNISTELDLINAAVDVSLSRTTADVVPVIPYLSSSVAAMMMSSSSDVMMQYSSSIICDMIMSSSVMATSSSMMPLSSMVIPTTTVFNTVTSTLITTSVSTVCPSSSQPVTPNTVTSTTTVTTTSISTSISISVYVTTSSTTSTLTVSASCSEDKASASITPTLDDSGRKNALARDVEVAGGALYFGIAGFIIAIVAILIFGTCCCIFCYQRGVRKGQHDEVKLQRDIEMSANNPIYDGISEMDSVSYRSSVDEKKLLEYMQ